MAFDAVVDGIKALVAFLAPPPISPFFQDGGLLYGVNEDVALVSFMLVFLYLTDLLVVKPYLHPKARYFALHALANTVSTVAAFPDVVRQLTYPLKAFTGATHTMVANSAVAGIHIYHCIGGFRLSSSDIFHHMLFVVILCGLAVPYKQVGGTANNFGCWFLSGLPGGVTYVMLVCVKQGLMKPMTEKRASAWINTWIRGPSMAIYGFVAWQAFYTGQAAFHTLPLFIIGFLHFFNGQYYAAEAVYNYAYRRGQASGQAKTVAAKAK